jgi:cysteine-S-conjugate beta-lyase
VGYPRFGPGGELGEAYTGFVQRHFSWSVDPDEVLPVVDVTAGLRLAIDVLSEPGPLVLPIPAYGPHHAIGEITGRERIDLALDPDAARAEIDLERLDRQFRDGARTLLLTQPHNPWGRVFSRAELEGVRDVVSRRGARVVSDEVHGPLALPGAEHVSYLSLDGTADHAVALVSASKPFNVAGLRCAQVIAPDRSAMERLFLAPPARNDSWSSLGAAAAVACYRHGDDWLAALLVRLDAQRALLAQLLATHLPEARMRPLEGTYLAWLDLRAYGHADPARVARRRGRVLVSAGQEFQPDLPGHIRLNIATSADRLTEIVRRLAKAVSGDGESS